MSQRIRQLFLTILHREPNGEEANSAAGFVDHIQSEQTAGGAEGWNYGYGTFDEGTAAVTKFTVFPWSADGTWQGGKTMPDPSLGWTSLQKAGGHPGGNLNFCAIRRWTADVDCRVILNSVIGHLKEEGDGVRFRILTEGKGVIADVEAHNSTAPTKAETLDIRAGQQIDFVADCRTNESHDSFRCTIMITQMVKGKVQRVWSSEKDFRDQASENRLNAWAQLAQALLLTNEFVFVD